MTIFCYFSMYFGHFNCCFGFPVVMAVQQRPLSTHLIGRELLSLESDWPIDRMEC